MKQFAFKAGDRITKIHLPKAPTVSANETKRQGELKAVTISGKTVLCKTDLFEVAITILDEGGALKAFDVLNEALKSGEKLTIETT